MSHAYNFPGLCKSNSHTRKYSSWCLVSRNFSLCSFSWSTNFSAKKLNSVLSILWSNALAPIYGFQKQRISDLMVPATESYYLRQCNFENRCSVCLLLRCIRRAYSPHTVCSSAHLAVCNCHGLIISRRIKNREAMFCFPTFVAEEIVGKKNIPIAFNILGQNVGKTRTKNFVPTELAEINLLYIIRSKHCAFVLK